MKILIEGKEYAVKGYTDDRRGIVTTEGTFEFFPLWQGDDWKLPTIPDKVERCRFCPPDLTDTHLPEIKAAWEKANQHRCRINKKADSRSQCQPWELDEFKAGPAVELIWKKHGTQEIAVQEGYDPDDAFEGPLLLMRPEVSIEALNAVRYRITLGNAGGIWYCRGMNKLLCAEKTEEKRDRVVFSNQFTAIDLLSIPTLHVDLRPRHADKALRFLYENMERGWIPWDEVVRAAGDPDWHGKRNPHECLHSRKPGDKKDLIEKIIFIRRAHSKFEVRLKVEEYRFEEK